MNEQDINKQIQDNSTDDRLIFMGGFNNIRIKDGVVKMEIAFNLADYSNIVQKLGMNTDKPVMFGIQLAQTELDI
ncbi:hypothetical protein WOSG25_250160 [Weissella oryzae SG25]|uniref:Uncharacterized protein n=1 Tax=Weissella oryzae (strain DSM 25784 / JCM 18191 / LMG 30913 / SG25) TaxID=1329250 RepID=A0A069CW62_WEIOS|nr:hypothetical protein [Weissella oryzae]GAK32045.1 hypothetical protein WOSG25_250160 [Weissella oryzae SG25]